VVVRLKTFYPDQKVNELFEMFKLPCVDYSKGYQPDPRPELTGASTTMTGQEAYRLKAVNELRRWMRQR
jgi:hypothetical protein